MEAITRTSEEYSQMRYCFAWNLKHTQGLTYKKVGEILGVTTERARQLVLKYERVTHRIQQELAAQEKSWLEVWGVHVAAETTHLNESLSSC